MEVEFTYRVNGFEGAEELEAACERAVQLNPAFSSYNIDTFDDDGGLYVRLRSTGHDKSAITRRIVAPIRSVFHRAKISTDRISLIGQRVMPNGRSLTAEEGRTKKGTFADESLIQMLADAARVEKLS
jgi:hypothetical protein